MAMATLTNKENTSTSFKTVIGMQTIAERIDSAKKTSASVGGGGANTPLDPKVIGTGRDKENNQPGEVSIEAKKVLRVERWYDLASAEANQ